MIPYKFIETHSTESPFLPDPGIVREPHRCSSSVTSLMKSGSVSQSSSGLDDIFNGIPAEDFHIFVDGN